MGPGVFRLLAVGAGIAFFLLWINNRRAQQRAIPEEDGGVLGPCMLRFDADGVYLCKKLSRTAYQWGSIRHVSATPEHLFLWVDRLAAIILPVRDLPQELPAAELQSQLQQMAAAAAGDAGTQSPAGFSHTPNVHATPAAAQQSASLRDFVAAAGRLLFSRVTPSTAFKLSDRALAGIVVCYLTAWLLFDWASAGAGAQFYSQGILALAWHAMVILMMAWLLTQLAVPRVSFREAFAMTLAMVPLYAAAWSVVRYLPELTWIIGMVLALHLGHCFHLGLQSITGRLQVRALVASICVMLAAVWVGSHVYANPQFWYAQEQESAQGDDYADLVAQQQRAESLLYRQGWMIDAEAARMQRPQQQGAAAFFLGFGGVGEQSVFASEIALAQRVISRHYDTADRSLQLVNDRRDLDAHPLASLSGLQLALAAVSSKMNLQQDVLFLALSSHGSRDATLSVSNGVLPLNDVSAQELAQALRESGIKNKVLIISACYAGTFIEPLRDPDTIIITAAAADRNSFGCADDRDLTYFGEAFYKNALQRTGNLRVAFGLAKAEIARREKDEGKRASNPQAYFGSQLEPYLQGWAAAPTE